MCQEEGKELEAVCGLQRTEQTDILYLTHTSLIGKPKRQLLVLSPSPGQS